MIRANELRIGNLIKYTGGEVCEVDHRDIKWISEKPKDFNECKQPIPLTEEWLNKLGFRGQDGYFYKPDSHGDFELHPSNDNKIFGIAIDGYVDVRLSKFIDLLFVHELQNFWFAVTGEELTTK